MDPLTRLFLVFTEHRARAIERYNHEAREIQERQLYYITRAMSRTEYGKRFAVEEGDDYEEYSRRVPIVAYESLGEDIDRMLYRKSPRILTAESTEWFAISSGTTNSRSKFIPVPGEHLKHCHFQGATDVLHLYLSMFPDSTILKHKSFALTGSLKKERFGPYVHAGDLSAVLVSRMPILAKQMRVPPEKVALMSEWEPKLDRTSDILMHEDMGSLSGAPSWTLMILKEVLRKSGVTHLKDLWPNLEVFFHGGIAFSPYREEYKRMLGEGVTYMETYNASEGFFGIQNDLSDPAMLLMLDYRVFYEFIPLDKFDEWTEQNRAIPLWKTVPGVNYAMVISTLGGLYRYLIGDTIKFTQKDPYKFIITGRTKLFINAFGEELMIGNTDKALEKTCRDLSCRVREYSVAPVFLNDSSQGYHHWVVEFEKAPKDENEFIETVHRYLRELNSDYAAKSQRELYMKMPRLTVVKSGTFLEWMGSRGKLGGQNKVPRLYKDTTFIDQIIALNEK